MAFAKEILDLRFAQNVVMLRDHGGLPPLPPVDEPIGGGDGKPERPFRKYSLLGDFAALIAFGFGGFTLGTITLITSGKQSHQMAAKAARTVDHSDKDFECEVIPQRAERVTLAPVACQLSWQLR